MRSCRYLFVATILAALTLSHVPHVAQAKKRNAPKKATMPSWRDIGKVAIDTLLEDTPQRLVREYHESREAELLAAERPYDPSLSKLAAVDLSNPDLTCDQVVNELILHIT